MHLPDAIRLPRMIGLCMLLGFSGCISKPPPTRIVCTTATPFPDGIEVVKAMRVFLAPNGESDVETVSYAGESKAYFKPGEMFTQNSLGGAKKVQLVSGPADAILPMHASPYREMFLTIQGSSAVTLPDGREFPIMPGTLVIFDDMGSKTGHGGRTGACGYVAINIVPADGGTKP